jgi:hypothetical protein
MQSSRNHRPWSSDGASPTKTHGGAARQRARGVDGLVVVGTGSMASRPAGALCSSALVVTRTGRERKARLLVRPLLSLPFSFGTALCSSAASLLTCASSAAGRPQSGSPPRRRRRSSCSVRPVSTVLHKTNPTNGTNGRRTRTTARHAACSASTKQILRRRRVPWRPLLGGAVVTPGAQRPAGSREQQLVPHEAATPRQISNDPARKRGGIGKRFGSSLSGRLPCFVVCTSPRLSSVVTGAGCVWFPSIFSWLDSLRSGSLRPGSQHAECRCLDVCTSRVRLKRAGVWLLVRDKSHEVKNIKKL